jgi:hypothetical protein
MLSATLSPTKGYIRDINRLILPKGLSCLRTINPDFFVKGIDESSFLQIKPEYITNTQSLKPEPPFLIAKIEFFDPVTRNQSSIHRILYKDIESNKSKYDFYNVENGDMCLPGVKSATITICNPDESPISLIQSLALIHKYFSSSVKNINLETYPIPLNLDYTKNTKVGIIDFVDFKPSIVYNNSLVDKL